MNSNIQSTRRGLEIENLINEAHHQIRKEKPQEQSSADVDPLLKMGVLVGRVEDAGNQEVFIGPHVNKDGEHEFQDVG